MKSYTILSLLALAGQTYAFTGEGTFYYPAGGYGSCGTTLNNYDMVAAVSFAQSTELPCDTCLRVTGPKGSVVVRVKDKCAGCKYGDIDVTYGAFIKIADEGAGRVAISSEVVSCDGSTAANKPFMQAESAKIPSVANTAGPLTVVPVKGIAGPSEWGRCDANSAIPQGNCCSQWGYLGSTSEYCGEGCQAGACW